MSAQPRLCVVPCTLQRARDYVGRYHRRHRPPLGGILSLAVVDEARSVRGVAIIGRPVARLMDDGLTAEVSRVATDGCPNACSALLGAARRAVFAMGYRRIITYTLPEEGGASLRGAGWRMDRRTEARPGPGGWDHRPDRTVDPTLRQSKHRWVSINRGTPDSPVQWPAPPKSPQVGMFGGTP